MNAFAFAPAIRRNTHVLIALAGASGSGKTYSALELATGLAGESGKIAVIDTEADRALHYADRFKFYHCPFPPPFTPDRYREAIVAAEEAGYEVIVIDSMSHEHDGEGGLIEMAEQELQKRKDGNSAAAWALPKAKHKRLMNRLLQIRSHLVFCLRAEDKIKMVKVFDERRGREITTVEPAGWQAVCEKRFMFEMTASFLLTPDNAGVPNPIKLQEQHRPAFSKGKVIGRESGRRIADWASGGAAPERHEADESATLNKRAIAAARGGKTSFRTFWQGLDSDERDHLRPMMKEFEVMATKADTDDDPFGHSDLREEQSLGGEP
jgi:AAA domain